MKLIRTIIYIVTITSTLALTVGCDNDSDAVLTILRCGDSVGPESPEKLESQQDTLNCSGTAVTVEGPVMLNLKGNTVSCDGSPGSVGIHIIGTSAEVVNGTVTNCETGVLVEGEGSHKIEDIVASGNGIEGIEAGGIIVNSDMNLLHRVTATMNQVFGVRVNGDQNNILESSVSENHFLGLVLYGSNNEVKDTVANNNSYTNIAITNVHGGGNDNLIEKNTTNGSGNDGIYIGGDNNQVVENEVNNNFISGIDTRGSQNNIENNMAIGNHTASELGDEFNFQGVDLEDDSRECDDNTWSGNDFMTSDAQGVQNSPCIQ